MKRETRANLIFLGIFLMLCLPGAVILFKKMYKPDARQMSLPDSVRRRLPYMTPLDSPDVMTRYAPPLTAEWVAQVARENGKLDEVLSEKLRPVISENHVVQLLGLNTGQADTTAYLLLWNDEVADADQRFAVAVVADSKQPRQGRVMTRQSIPLPQPIRRELMNGGYIKPPYHVTLLTVALDARLTPRSPLTLDVTYQTPTGPTITSVNAFTNPE